MTFIAYFIVCFNIVKRVSENYFRLDFLEISTMKERHLCTDRDVNKEILYFYNNQSDIIFLFLNNMVLKCQKEKYSYLVNFLGAYLLF